MLTHLHPRSLWRRLVSSNDNANRMQMTGVSALCKHWSYQARMAQREGKYKHAMKYLLLVKSLAHCVLTIFNVFANAIKSTARLRGLIRLSQLCVLVILYMHSLSTLIETPAHLYICADVRIIYIYIYMW